MISNDSTRDLVTGVLYAVIVLLAGVAMVRLPLKWLIVATAPFTLFWLYLMVQYGLVLAN